MSQAEPHISVLMPARNSAAYVTRAIESILHQTFDNWELLIADDASTDKTRAIIDQYDDPRIRRFHSNTQFGVADARNRLLQKAQGEVIAWQDADDISCPTRLEKLLAAFDRQPDLALCGSNVIYPYHQYFAGSVTSQYPLTHEEIRDAICQRKKVLIAGASSAFRRDVLKDVSGFRSFFNLGGEDADFNLRVSEKFCVGNIPEVLYECRYTRNSTARGITADHFLKMHLIEIIFFLADQRANHSGLDGLMDGGDREAFERLVEGFRRKFLQDTSVIYRHTCRLKLHYQDHVFAVFDAIRAISANPRAKANYRLTMGAGKQLARAFYRKVRSKT